MKMNRFGEYKSYEEIRKLSQTFADIKVKCSCGHTQVIPVYRDTMYCAYCGKKLKNNTRLYFIYKMRKELENEKKEKKERK